MTRTSSTEEHSGVILDIGANNGDFAIAMAERNPAALVVAVEPVKELAEGIRSRAEAAGLANVVVCEVAVADHQGEATLNIATEGDRGVTSLLPFDAELVSTDEYWKTRADLRFSGTETVRVVTLEDILREQDRDTVDFVKIDVQGKDLAALLSAGPLLSGVQAGMLETSSTEHTRLYENEPTLRDVLDVLAEHKFDVYAIKPNDPAANEVNVFFVRAGEDPRAVEDRLSLRGVHLYDGKHFWGLPHDSAESMLDALAHLAPSERLQEIQDRNEVLEARVLQVEQDLESTKAARAQFDDELACLRRRHDEQVAEASRSTTRLHAALDQALERLDAAREERDVARTELAELRHHAESDNDLASAVARRSATALRGLNRRLPERARPVATLAARLARRFAR